MLNCPVAQLVTYFHSHANAFLQGIMERWQNLRSCIVSITNIRRVQVLYQYYLVTCRHNLDIECQTDPAAEKLSAIIRIAYILGVGSFWILGGQTNRCHINTWGGERGARVYCKTYINAGEVSEDFLSFWLFYCLEASLKSKQWISIYKKPNVKCKYNISKRGKF